MGTVSLRISATPSDVYAILADGWSYAAWVVGASRIRDVDRSWPGPGSKIHHSVGAWPLVLNDYTEVLHEDPDQTLVLQARGWPAGEARVEFRLEPDGPDATVVTITEDATSGPGRFVPRRLRDLVIDARNNETLRRLSYIAQSGRGQAELGDPSWNRPSS